MVFFLQGLSGDDGIPGRPGGVGDRVCEKKKRLWWLDGVFRVNISQV